MKDPWFFFVLALTFWFDLHLSRRTLYLSGVIWRILLILLILDHHLLPSSLWKSHYPEWWRILTQRAGSRLKFVLGFYCRHPLRWTPVWRLSSIPYSWPRYFALATMALTPYLCPFHVSFGRCRSDNAHWVQLFWLRSLSVQDCQGRTAASQRVFLCSSVSDGSAFRHGVQWQGLRWYLSIERTDQCFHQCHSRRFQAQTENWKTFTQRLSAFLWMSTGRPLLDHPRQSLHHLSTRTQSSQSAATWQLVLLWSHGLASRSRSYDMDEDWICSLMNCSWFHMLVQTCLEGFSCQCQSRLLAGSLA